MRKVVPRTVSTGWISERPKPLSSPGAQARGLSSKGTRYITWTLCCEPTLVSSTENGRGAAGAAGVDTATAGALERVTAVLETATGWAAAAEARQARRSAVIPSL